MSKKVTMKKNSLLSRGLVTLSLLLSGIVTTHAQYVANDSVFESNKMQHDYSLRFTEVAIPVTLITASSLFVDNDWLAQQRDNMQDIFSAKGKNRVRIDDYMQYSPMVAVYGLNLCGVEGKHSFVDRTIVLAMAYAIQGTVTHTMKAAFKEKRPDNNSRNSFPSGHTATAFMGAQFLYEEYKDVSPWIGYAGYAVATATGYLRIYNNRHYINDVIAGACVGVLSTKLAYWLYPKIFKWSNCNKQTLVSGLPYYSLGEVGMNISLRF